MNSQFHFEIFREHLIDFFITIGKFYYTATPIILQYLKHQMLNVLVVYNTLAKEDILKNFDKVMKKVKKSKIPRWDKL